MVYEVIRRAIKKSMMRRLKITILFSLLLLLSVACGELRVAPEATTEVTPALAPGVTPDFDLGMAAWLNGEYGEAVKHWRPLAEQGNAKAQYYLASLYKLGYAVPQSDREAIRWIRQSAEQGYPESQYLLGRVLLSGSDGVEQDVAQGREWVLRAAEQGDHNALIYLGPREWLSAAEQGDPRSQYFMAQLSLYGLGVEQDTAQAEQWLNRAAEGGHLRSQYLLGVLRFWGRRGAAVDRAKGMEWLQRAAEAGFSEAQFELGDIYAYEPGYQNSRKAIRWYLKAALQWHSAAQYSLGNMYREGWGVSKSRTKAYMWFEITSEAGDTISALARDEVARHMSKVQIARAQQLARNWIKQHPRP
jgi:TPR repeat protein